MRKELLTLGALLGLAALSESAFSRPVRRQAGNMTGWRCGETRCKKSFWEGWLIDIHHKIPEWMGGQDVLENAAPRCLEHHYRAHKGSVHPEDQRAARLIYGRIQDTGGGRTRAWLRKNRK